MGIWSALRKKLGRRKSEEKGTPHVYYDLRYMGPDGGWYSTGLKYDRPIEPNEIPQFLGPGRYWLVRIEKGKPGFRPAWEKPVEIQFDIPEMAQEEKPRRRRERRSDNPLADFLTMLMTIATDEEARKSLENSVKFLHRVFVGPTLEESIEKVAEFREKLKKANAALGIDSGYKEEEGPEYEGKIPAWLHPKVLRSVKEMIKETVSEVIGGAAGGGGSVDIPPMPEEPEISEAEEAEESE